LLLDDIRDQALTIEQRQGSAAAGAFYKAATINQITLREAAEEWLAEVARSRKRKSVAGHRKVLVDLERFLRGHHGLPSLDTTVFADVTRRMAGDFIHWRSQQVSSSAVKREVSAPMGLWRWALRRGHAEVNPWTDQASGLGDGVGGSRDGAKRPYTTSELVTLLHTGGAEWAPNGGGYGATLWDATRLGLLTGLRAVELADLRICDLMNDHTAIMVPIGKTRNARRLIPLPRAASDVIAARLADLPDTSPDAPLWPEVPVLGLTGSRGGKLSDRFRIARQRLLR
jgi:integrase